MNRVKKIAGWINFMRTIFLIGFLLIFSGSALAIDRVKKDKASKEQKESVPQEKATPSRVEPDKSQREEKASASEKKVEQTEPQVEREKKPEGVIKKMTKEDYDYFIDSFSTFNRFITSLFCSYPLTKNVFSQSTASLTLLTV